MNEPAEGAISVLERSAIAALCFLAALVTVIGLAVIIVAYADISIVLSYAFVTAASIFVVAAPIAGFVLGPERAPQLWGVIWGTERRSRWQTVVIFSIIAIVCLIGIYEHAPW